MVARDEPVKDPYDPTKRAANFNVGAGGEAAKKLIDKDLSKYNNAPHESKNKGVSSVKKARAKHAPNADKPTTASADPSQKLPETVKKVDPQAASAILQNMLSMLAMVRNTSNATSPVTTTKIVTDALGGALAILAHKHGFERVIKVFKECLENNGINRISPEYRTIVKEALALLIKNSIENGPNTLKLSEKPTVIKYQVGGRVPIPVYGFPPDLYIQQYYTVEEDPFPGYIQWKGPNGDYIYTVRGAELHFTNADDHIYSMAEEQLAKDLEPYIIKGKLTPEQLNAILDKNSKQVQNNGMNKSMGQNSGQNLMQLLNMLLGIAGPILNKAKSGHLPQSVMDQGSMNKSLEKFAKNMSIAKKMKDDAKNAFNLPGPLAGLLGGGLNMGGALGSLGSLGSLGNIAGSLGSIGNLGNISGLAGNITSLTNLGSVGNIAIGLGSMGVSPETLQNVGSLMNIASDGQSGFLSPEAAKLAAATGKTITVNL